ncbi:hypothetical protein WOLCODRAFT_152952 [Wolfiporia cocos MD-104 SS10]|uniref:ATPase inhibitor, mitochondrial n=1 Tax=Wolfiporia cocos (strain MD-104) TaxID=742152 RepID=A0A2H3K3B5_WOLCO|nr:hypothetical protein WOLCODRAFT_152952 [Wolfiporia cocos MD-104 SS10]
MLSRIATTSARRIPRVTPAATRLYSEDAFNKKEKAHEDQYARQHEKEQLKKLKAEIERKKAELAQLEKEHAEAVSKQN